MLQLQAVEPNTLELLKKLQALPHLEKFYLVGGTAIALHLGHRMSIDLDLFTFEDFHAPDLFEYLSQQFNLIEENITTPNTLLCKIEGIKTDFIKYRYPPQFPIIRENGISMLSLEDLIPMKLSAIASRGRKKDFYDVYYLLQKFPIPQMIHLYEEKFENASVFHLLKSLTYFEDAEPDAPPVVFEKISWTQIKKYIQQKVRSL